MDSDASRDVISGAVWERFCDNLRRAGQQVLRPETPVTELERAEGFRYLTRLLRIGLEMHLEYADPAFPGFFSPSHETAKIGADNPDNLYLMARLDGRYDYIVEGDRGSVAYLSFGTQKGGYESDGKMIQTGFLDAADMQLDADGSFLMTRDTAQLTVGDDQIHVRGGRADHAWTQIRGALPALPGRRLFVTGFTPMRHTLEFRP